jgi:hypothetical protein
MLYNLGNTFSHEVEHGDLSNKINEGTNIWDRVKDLAVGFKSANWLLLINELNFY